MTEKRTYSRRDLLKFASIGLIGLAARPVLKYAPPGELAETPKFLGRVTAPSLNIMDAPNPRSELFGTALRDEIIPVYEYVVGEGWYPHNHIWARTPDGYMYSSFLQPVENVMSAPVLDIPEYGFFGEVAVPYVDSRLGPGEQYEINYRNPYAVVFLIDEVTQDDTGKYWYHVDNENGYTLWVPAETVRPIPEADLQPITPEVEDKLIQVDLSTQWLMAYENGREVFRTRISSGTAYFNTSNPPPVGQPIASSPIWWKRISRHMQGGTVEAGWDLPGVGFATYFLSSGEAIHSTFWHNDFGRPRSAGCLNVNPAAAKWLFRWTQPYVEYVPGNKIVDWPGGTRVEVYRAGVS